MREAEECMREANRAILTEEHAYHRCFLAFGFALGLDAAETAGRFSMLSAGVEEGPADIEEGPAVTRLACKMPREDDVAGTRAGV